MHYRSQNKELKRKVRGLEIVVKSLKHDVDVLDECTTRDIVVDLINEMVPLIISDKRMKDTEPQTLCIKIFVLANGLSPIHPNPVWIVEESQEEGQVTEKCYRPKRKGPEDQ